MARGADTGYPQGKPGALQDSPQPRGLMATAFMFPSRRPGSSALSRRHGVILSPEA